MKGAARNERRTPQALKMNLMEQKRKKKDLVMTAGADPEIFRRGGSVRHIHTDKRVLNADGIPHLPLCLTVSNELIKS